MKTKLLHTIGAMAMTWPVMGATLTSGHVDFIGIGYVGGALEPHSHAHAAAIVDGSPLAGDTEFEVGELELVVVGNTTREPGAEWSPVGISAGLGFWLLPQTEIIGQPFSGIGAEELDPMDWNGSIRISLSSMAAPVGGQFSLWQLDSFDMPQFFMSTFDGGITASDYFDIPAGGHAHFGWGFTELGVYDLTFNFSGDHVTDGLKTASGTYRFNVIPEPSTGLMGLFGIGLLWRRKRQ
jgi:surface-anchored protein